jgi:hypothetical protein
MSNTDTTKKTGANSRITENIGNMTQIRNKENKDTTQKLNKMSNTDTTKKTGANSMFSLFLICVMFPMFSVVL